MAANYWCCGTTFAIFLILLHFNLRAATKQNDDFFKLENNSLDISILKSKSEKFLVYRNAAKKECYLEQVSSKNSEDEQNSRTLYVGKEQLKKSDKEYNELDEDTRNFCNQFAIFVLQVQPPTYTTKDRHGRKRRGVQMLQGPRYRGQTQRQYISFDPGSVNNTADTQVPSGPQKSRITVSGNLRLEQSQTQFQSFDCSECTSWPQGPQKPTGSEHQSPPEQSFAPSTQQQPGSLQSLNPAPAPSGGYPSGQGVPQSTIPGQQSTPYGTSSIPVIGYQGSGNLVPSNQFYNTQPSVASQFYGKYPNTEYVPNNLQTGQPTGNAVYPQSTAYFRPSPSPNQQVVPQTLQYLPPESQSTFRVGSENTLISSQGTGSGFQPAHQSNFANPTIGSQTSPVIPPNSQVSFEGTQPQGSQYYFSSLQKPSFSTWTPSSSQSQNSPVNPVSVNYYSGNSNNFSNSPGYFSSNAESSQPRTSIPQYFSPNTAYSNPQTIPQNSWPAGSRQGTSQITGYFPSGPQNTPYQGYSGGVISPQTPPIPSLQTIPQQGSGDATYSSPGLQVPQGYAPQTNFMRHQQSAGEAITNPQLYIYSSLGSSSQSQSSPSRGLIYCRSCTYVPAGSQSQYSNSSIPNQLPSSQPTPQQSSGNTLPQNAGSWLPQAQGQIPSSSNFQYKIPQQTSHYPVGPGVSPWFTTSPETNQTYYPNALPYQPNSGLNPQYNKNYSQFNYISPVTYTEPQILPASGSTATQSGQTHGSTNYLPPQESTFSQAGQAIDPNYPFQTQYIPQTYVPQQPQSGPTESQVNQPASPSYTPSSVGYSGQNYPKAEPAIQPSPAPPISRFPSSTSRGETTNYPQQTYVVPPNCTWELPAASQNGSSVDAEDIEEALSVSSINFINNATRAEAISQGKTKKGIVKTEVSGTYTKDFAAKAQTIDIDRSAISQIFGNATGAISTSYGRAGKSKSQSRVLFSHETGSAVAESQGTGVGYNFTGQIQVGLQGGRADSQATGPGSTFSQAQIGFVPIAKEGSLQTSIFQGGGTASSNISRYSGMTGIRFQGQFASGPRFSGQAEAGTGKVSPNKTRIAFNSTNLTNLSQTTTPEVDKVADIVTLKKTEDDKDSNTSNLKLILPQPSTNNSLDTLNDFGTQTSNPQKRLLRGQSSSQKLVPSSVNMVHSVDPSTAKFLYPGEIIPGTKNHRVPSGFRGRLLPEDVQPSVTNSGPITEIDYKTPLKQGKVYIQKDSFENQQYPFKDGYDGYMTVTKSETGQLKNKDRNYDHTYYSKSSTCGFFTYTCNLIDGPDGRTKICKQSPPSDADGIPC